MKVTNCTWELNNLGCKVAEIDCTEDVTIDSSLIKDVETKYDYIVVKVPILKSQINSFLSQRQYVCIESQLSIKIKMKDLKMQSGLLENIGHVQAETINNEKDLLSLLSRMTESMFTTDRIYLDSNFGPIYSLKRYRNWISSEYHRGTKVYKILIDGEWVGLFMPKENNTTMDGLLGGLFAEFQGNGLGIVLPLMPLFINSSVQKYETKISSNNFPVIQVYNQCGYRFTNVEYVFIKHVK